MKTYLKYIHSRNIFTGNDYKSFINKYFKDVKFEGFEYGYWFPVISISNWEEIKNKLPKSYIPDKIMSEKEYKEYLSQLF